MVAIMILFCGCASFKSHTNSANTSQIVGVWKIVSPALSEEGEQEKIKIITKDRFIWTHTFNGVIVMSTGGAYSFDGKNYVENIEFGTLYQKSAFGQKAFYKVQFSGKTKRITGGFENDNRVFDEIWERIE